MYENQFAKNTYNRLGADSTTYRVLDRNAKNWNKAVVVSDWTSSMYPYTAQLLIYALSAPQGQVDVVRFVFFNDGDEKETSDKKLGQAGGIYHSKTNSLEDALETMKLCAAKGKGGDVPENDIEAILEAIQSYPEAQRVLLIADNSAPVRDIELLSKVTKPVNIILGRSHGFPYINQDFIRIARETKGSLHTEYNDYQGESLEKLIKDIEAYKAKQKRKN
ncbi:MAG: hypothetical protein EAZ57_00910 [Cytophagales bacterium]|nr:MAG: hypothetical protein EAZ67_00220 [Cytophagales bacterium]TAF62345.1 MAG: hypothetical protein EAZ57_00910 [Cytophagales bacterium]